MTISMDGLDSSNPTSHMNLRRPVRARLSIGSRTYANELRATARFTDRDFRMVRLIYHTGLLSRDQLQRLFWQEVRASGTVSDRLRVLYKRWVVNIAPDVSYNMRRAGMVPCHVYTLGTVGEEIMALDEHKRRHELAYNRRYATGRSRQNIMHDLMTAEIYVQAIAYAGQYNRQLWQAIESDEQYKARRLLIRWHSEREAAVWQTDKELVRPDGAMEIIIGRERSFFFVELDRGHTRWEKKVAVYDNARQFGGWQNQFGIHDYPAVLLVVPDGHSQRVGDRVAAQKPQTRYLLKEWSDFLAEPMAGWQDVGGDRNIALTPDTIVSPER